MMRVDLRYDIGRDRLIAHVATDAEYNPDACQDMVNRAKDALSNSYGEILALNVKFADEPAE